MMHQRFYHILFGGIMKQFIKKYWKTLLFFAIAGLVGGFCVGLYGFDSSPLEMQQDYLSQGLTPAIIALVYALQGVGYGVVLGIIGILLGKKTGLWKDETNFAKKPLLITLAIALIGGLALIFVSIAGFTFAILYNPFKKKKAPAKAGARYSGSPSRENRRREDNRPTFNPDDYNDGF
jgi:hypothetical protein